MRRVDGHEQPEQEGHETVEQAIPGRSTAWPGRLACPFSGLLSGWAVLCGALASNHLSWRGEALLTLALVLLLAGLAWSNLWELAADTDWLRPLAEKWPPSRPTGWRGLPYTQPSSPAGRLTRGLNRLAGWWREAFWPAAGLALVGVGAAVLLAVVLTLLLPDRIRPLNAALLALLGLGVAMRRRGKDSLAGRALLQAGLSWLAGHLAFADLSLVSAGLALGWAVAVLGMFKVHDGRMAGLWLINAGQAASALWLAAFGRPLAAGLVGLLLLGQVALQPALRAGKVGPDVQRAWPWLLAAMLVAAGACP